ncbi:hypothetical protein CDL15_Pgr024045 [Punica granatum]|uniref:S-acyltransferase n=1 Tax=Punica granatum TaxID=22663 RepID=A0A218XWU2_PUNGR|nr:hypothetical protein CDL15_Pgr024045 [Punica granatum]
MAESGARRRLVPSTESIGRCMVCCFFVFLSQLALISVSHFFSTSSFLAQLCLSGGRCRRLIGVSASAPAFVVVTIVYTWSVYTAVVRQAVSRFMDVLFNGEVALLMIGLCSMFTMDPGLVADGDPSSSRLAECQTENPPLAGRVRFCRICKAYVKGFDHHCPAFGNCIGQNNYVLFMALLVGFLSTEASFVACSYQFLAKSQTSHQTRFDSTLDMDVVNGAMLFSFLQLLWQAIFFAWHVYCVCFNIKTEEWVNWKRYPEFQVLIEDEQVQGHSGTQFRNPYDKGIQQNVNEFFILTR